ncbi:MAG: nuclear transport factor 2 family protein [Pseudomonadota bacterium]|nr:nuclear transport factor 2 family protein [Pseudomonadota bacterium]
MNNNNPADVVNRYFQAVASGDVPTAVAMFSPDLVWHQPGNNRFSGSHHGPDGFGALIGGMMAVSEGSFTLTVTGPALVNGELVAVPVHFSGKRAGASMDMDGIDLLRVRDGRIVEVFLFSGDGAAEDAFWGQAD